MEISDVPLDVPPTSVAGESARLITHFDRERKTHRERQKGARAHKAKAKQKPGLPSDGSVVRGNYANGNL